MNAVIGINQGIPCVISGVGIPILMPAPPTFLFPYDPLETYTDGVQLNTLNDGYNWNGSFVSKNSLLGIQSSDDMESYTDTDGLNGLNGGTTWNGAFVSR